jgi:hypothetical protein
MRMSDIFSDARRSFEVQPNAGTLDHSIGKLAGAGVELDRIRGWAFGISREYGIIDYIRPELDRMLNAAANPKQPNAISTESAAS